MRNLNPHVILFLGYTQVLSPNGMLIGSPIFAGLTPVTDRQTDHANRSVTIGCIFVRSTAMQPNNDHYELFIGANPSVSKFLYFCICDTPLNFAAYKVHYLKRD